MNLDQLSIELCNYLVSMEGVDQIEKEHKLVALIQDSLDQQKPTFDSLHDFSSEAQESKGHVEFMDLSERSCAYEQKEMKEEPPLDQDLSFSFPKKEDPYFSLKKRIASSFAERKRYFFLKVFVNLLKKEALVKQGPLEEFLWKQTSSVCSLLNFFSELAPDYLASLPQEIKTLTSFQQGCLRFAQRAVDLHFPQEHSSFLHHDSSDPLSDFQYHQFGQELDFFAHLFIHDSSFLQRHEGLLRSVIHSLVRYDVSFKKRTKEDLMNRLKAIASTSSPAVHLEKTHEVKKISFSDLEQKISLSLIDFFLILLLCLGGIFLIAGIFYPVMAFLSLLSLSLACVVHLTHSLLFKKDFFLPAPVKTVTPIHQSPPSQKCQGHLTPICQILAKMNPAHSYEEEKKPEDDSSFSISI
jgi:hypothetical protein